MPPKSASGSQSAQQAIATIAGSTGELHRSRSFELSSQNIFAILLAFRIVNALTLCTFFQPDEFFQSLEPAWQLAFGQRSNAWITWEWRTQLRTALHPEIFAGVYQVAAKLANLCNLSLPFQAELFIAAPKVTQAVFAALLDCYTWKLAESVYGRASRAAFTTLALSVASPWQWFCSTRTLSNCLETTITSIAVYYWPWHWPDAARDREFRDNVNKRIADKDWLGPLSQLRLSLLLAAFACIFRPTNLLIWLCISIPTVWQASSRQRYVLVREILFCGSAVLACSVLSDKLYYQVWTLPPLRFLYFNIVQSLAVFYGRNRGDYYLTEGLPLLLTTALPFAVIGTWQSLQGKPAQATGSGTEEVRSCRILGRLAWTSIVVTLSLSTISHKEVRFLYPVLPFLHILSARLVSSFLTPFTPSRKAILTIGLLVNLLIAGYTSQVHQRGVIDVLSYLRHKHEARNTATTVGFLMPCHSTPWRSHLVHPAIDAWALTCEPPLDIPLSQRDKYLDEADQFYIKPGPVGWLDQHMDDLQTVSGSRTGRHWAKLNPTFTQEGRRPWPQNLVFFEALEPTMRKYLKGTGYKECWRGFNTHFHDDRRRKGDVIVWCLD
ncbi:glycosyltransferase family 22 protein [Zopfia rhizophila CBS 207.26]|uniref:Mannosyltransferase n=1 Tax=Zopfia rhizophila CBS 207.26 TaxID=1314779 RepID=A0A6A6DF59_9PEZI|nr:glycosyltransferase family 22 protein [Zopfia rhizophila CBS 207.26]